MFGDGSGVEKDDNKAFHWFRDSAVQNHADAQDACGKISGSHKGIAQIYSEALEWFTKAAKQENADAQNALGMMYRDGQDAVTARGTELIFQAAAGGLVTQIVLGDIP